MTMPRDSWSESWKAPLMVFAIAFAGAGIVTAVNLWLDDLDVQPAGDREWRQLDDSDTDCAMLIAEREGSDWYRVTFDVDCAQEAYPEAEIRVVKDGRQTE